MCVQGANLHGQVGDGTLTQRLTPTVVFFDGWWNSLATGDFHSCGIRSDTSLWCWVRLAAASSPQLHDLRCPGVDNTGPPAVSQGLNSVGQVGDGSTKTPLLPMAIGTSTGWSTLALGTGSSCAINSSGSLFCWGANSNGQLGDGSTTPRTTPTASGTGVSWTSVSLGAQAACGVAGTPSAPPPRPALPPAPPLYMEPTCWGNNSFGQFGNGSASGSRTAPANSTSTVWEQLSLSDTTACAIQRSVLALHCWGSDPARWGTLGDGQGSGHYLPLQVSGGGQWADVYAANGFSCGIRTDGLLFCWGFNMYFGAVGDNTTSNRLTPVAVAPAVTWRALPPRGYGGHFTCAIQTNDSLWCWVRGKVDLSETIPAQPASSNDIPKPYTCRVATMLASLETAPRCIVYCRSRWSPHPPGLPLQLEKRTRVPSGPTGAFIAG